MGRDQGTYLLLLRLKEGRALAVGRLGAFSFPAGYYVYVGRARRGLAARISRHLRRGKPLRWHIDYLREHAEVVAVSREEGEPQECLWAGRMGQMAGAGIVAPGFGASDCSCPSHLFYFSEKPEPFSFRSAHHCRMRSAMPFS